MHREGGICADQLALSWKWILTMLVRTWEACENFSKPSKDILYYSITNDYTFETHTLGFIAVMEHRLFPLKFLVIFFTLGWSMGLNIWLFPIVWLVFFLLNIETWKVVSNFLLRKRKRLGEVEYRPPKVSSI